MSSNSRILLDVLEHAMGRNPILVEMIQQDCSVLWAGMARHSQPIAFQVDSHNGLARIHGPWPGDPLSVHSGVISIRIDGTVASVSRIRRLHALGIIQ